MFTKPIAPLHFDLQYRSISWPRGADLTRHLSFTLSVRLPSAGGGLDIWDVSHEQFRHAPAKGWVGSVADLKRFHTLRYVPYPVGRMVIHSGHGLQGEHIVDGNLRTDCHRAARLGEDEGVVAVADHPVLGVPEHGTGQDRAFHVGAPAG